MPSGQTALALRRDESDPRDARPRRPSASGVGRLGDPLGVSEPGRYLEWFPRLVEVIGGSAFERSTAALHPEGVAAAIWVEPEAELDEEALVALLLAGSPPMCPMLRSPR